MAAFAFFASSPILATQGSTTARKSHLSSTRSSFARTSRIRHVIAAPRSASRHNFVFSTPRAAANSTPAPPRILIVGAPASGKGTQCKYIAEEYGVVHISTGDMLRAAVASGSELGVTAKEYMDGGKLVPDSLVTAMLVERLNSSDCQEKGWLLDGFPRTAPQAQALIAQGIVPIVAINLIVPDSVLVNRVVGRRMDSKTGEIYHVDFNPPPAGTECIIRSDDTAEKANVRIATFKTHAKAVQDKYSDILANVDGNRDKKTVFADIRTEIDDKLKKDDDTTGGDANAAGDSSDEGKQSKGMPIDEFVRRAEAAYERGVLENENVAWSGQAGLDKLDPDTRDIRDAARRPLLAAGDALAFILFAYIGRSNHGSSAFDFAVFKTAIPFLVGWYTVAPFAGAYTKEATDNFRSAAVKLGQAWVPSVALALGIRTVSLHHQPPTPFIIVSFVATAIVLGAWRISYVKVKGPENEAGRQGNILDGFKMVNTLLRRW